MSRAIGCAAFNLPRQCADGPLMAEVEAVRSAAPEHNLQFVDLEKVTIDPGAAAVLPASVARRHFVVPIGRRFGAPVVAMADPDDVMAVDTLRATLGRDFICVQASTSQIEQVLDRVYPMPRRPEPRPAPAPAPAAAPAPAPSPAPSTSPAASPPVRRAPAPAAPAPAAPPQSKVAP